MEATKQTILVGLSGGVDSAVATILLKEQGYNVIGATMAIWGERQVNNEHKSCKDACFSPHEKEDIESARKIAKNLDIPYYVFDCSKDYEKIVLNNFKNEYLKGHTPNPCIRCNSLIKFGVLPLVARQNGVHFDKFATGHYAKIEKSDEKFILKMATDKTKDQSYFLSRLKQEQLRNIILPLGNYTKPEIREIARKYKLNVADKPDSQDFYDGDYNELLEVKDKIGNIVDLEGNILGTHKGIWNYTIGQRKGLKISSDKPLYVLSLDKDKNEVIVGNIDKTFKKSLIAIDLNYPSDENITPNMTLTAKIRSSQTPQEVKVEPIKDKIKVNFKDYQKSIAPGQTVVLYQNEKVICAGTIDIVE